MKLMALHGFCLGSGVDVARGQVWAPASASIAVADIITWRAFVVAEGTATTAVGADILTTPVFHTNAYPSHPISVLELDAEATLVT